MTCAGTRTATPAVLVGASQLWLQCAHRGLLSLHGLSVVSCPELDGFVTEGRIRLGRLCLASCSLIQWYEYDPTFGLASEFVPRSNSLLRYPKNPDERIRTPEVVTRQRSSRIAAYCNEFALTN